MLIDSAAGVSGFFSPGFHQNFACGKPEVTEKLLPKPKIRAFRSSENQDSGLSRAGKTGNPCFQVQENQESESSKSSKSSACSEVLSSLLSSSRSSSEVAPEEADVFPPDVEDDDCDAVFLAAFEGLS